MASKNATRATPRKSPRGVKRKTDFIDEAHNVPWTQPERRRLLSALKEHGSSDLQKLASAVRTKSAAAVSYFLDKQSKVHKKSTSVKGTSMTALANWFRVMTKPKTKPRRSFDRSRVLLEVVERCAEGPFVSTAEDPHLDDLYRLLLDVMENHVPATLSPTDQWLLNRVLATHARMMTSLNLDLEREAVLQAARRIEETGESPPANTDRTTTRPSLEERMQGLAQSWNPLGLSEDTLRRPQQLAAAWLAGRHSSRQ